MIPLRCTVRGCEGRLERIATVLRCPSGHAFDRAREGYWNLLQPQDRRSRRAGDSAAAVEARSRWVARGLADGLLAAMASTLERLALPEGATVVDLGVSAGRKAFLAGRMPMRLHAAASSPMTGLEGS